VGDRDAAEDLAQDTFVEAFKQIGRLRDPARLGAWLHGITQRLCYKHLRRHSRVTAVEGEQLDLVAGPPDKHDEPGELCHLLNSLPAQYRQVLAARYLEDLDYEEIADMLGTTVNNVRVRCHRAKNRLRELFEAVENARKDAQTGADSGRRLRVVNGGSS
jgi:RNA polymerase sigma-70 factor (ECF subfamily)